MPLAAGVTPDPLDHSFVWQLQTVLQAVDALSVSDASGCPSLQVRLWLAQQGPVASDLCIIGLLALHMIADLVNSLSSKTERVLIF